MLTSRSHRDWEKETIEKHNLDKPFAPENGNALLFKVGDEVIYTNDYGVKFRFRVTGLYLPDPIDAQYALGGRYLLDWECPWFPVKERNLEEAFEPRFEEIIYA